MTTYVLTNDFQTTLAAALSSSGTTITVSDTTNLPTLGAGQIMPLILNDSATQQVYETCYVTAISGSTLTVLRGQEGSSALAWGIGDYCYCSTTAGTVATKTGDPNTAFQVADAAVNSEAVNLGQLSGLFVPTGSDGSNIITVTSSTTLTAANSGHKIDPWGATGAITLTLPTIAKGLNYVVLPAQYNVNLNGGSTQIVGSDGAAATTLTMSPTPENTLLIEASQDGGKWLARQLGQTVVANPVAGNQALNRSYADGRYAALAGLASQVFSVGTASGTTQAPRLGQFSGAGFGNYSGESPGSMYLTLANDASPTKQIIIQMGYVKGNNAGNSVHVTFPITFPNTVLNVQLTANGGQYANTFGIALDNTASPNLTNSYMVINGGLTTSSKMPMFWLAIGY